MIAATLDPLRIHRPARLKNVELIIEYADKNNHDPYELLAIASVESNFNPRAISSAGAVGLFQVMCKCWYKKTGYKTLPQCNKDMMNPKPSIKAGAMILSTIRKKYTQCRGDLAYRCYFAGARWKKYKDGSRTAKKIISYQNKVVKTRQQLHSYHYKDFIEGIRAKFKLRS